MTREAGGTRPVCPECDRTLPEGFSQCPHCLLELGLEIEIEDETLGTRASVRGRAPRPEDLAPLFPQLEILSLLGEGGMGIVYKARHRKLDRFVALKILPLDPADERGFAPRFLREARVLAKLQHPNIVAVHDFGEVEGHFYLVMEYVEGVHLRTLLGGEGLEPRQALAIVPQICDALQYAHDRNVVHRDVKPENILVDRHGVVKIADFGLAKLLGEARVDATITRDDQAMGTPHYMAPEQVRGAGGVDHRADIYSLGVVLYEMLTGRLPLGHFPPPSRRLAIDVRLDQVVLKALEQEPEKRYQRAADVKTDVTAVSLTPAAPAAEAEPERGPERSLAARAARSLAAFLAAGVLAAVAFNAGAVGAALAGVLFAVGGLWGMGAPAGRRGSRGATAAGWARVGLGAALLSAAFGFFFVAEVSSWENGTAAYLPGPRSPEELARAFVVSPPSGESTRSWIPAGTDEKDRARIFRHTEAWVPAVLLVLLASLVAPRGRERPRGGRLLPAATSLAALSVIHVFLAHASFGSDPSASLAVAGSRDMTGDAASVARSLYLSLVEERFEVTSVQRWRLDDPSLPPAAAEILAAQAPSPFARWRMTWRGPERITPHVVFRVTEHPGGEGVRVTFDAGELPDTAARLARWTSWIQDVLRRTSERPAETG